MTLNSRRCGHLTPQLDLLELHEKMLQHITKEQSVFLQVVTKLKGMFTAVVQKVFHLLCLHLTLLLPVRYLPLLTSTLGAPTTGAGVIFGVTG